MYNVPLLAIFQLFTILQISADQRANIHLVLMLPNQKHPLTVLGSKEMKELYDHFAEQFTWHRNQGPDFRDSPKNRKIWTVRELFPST